MKDLVKIGGKLAVICAVAAAVLGVMNAITEPQIEHIKQVRLEKALKQVSKGMNIGEQKAVSEDDVVDAYYPLYEGTDQGVPNGYILRMIGSGYGGDMVILASFETDGEVLSVQLMENSETPGLGKEAEKQSYMKKFTGTGDQEPIPVRKDMLSQEQSDAVTGATITFVGIAKALVEGSDFVNELEDK